MILRTPRFGLNLILLFAAGIFSSRAQLVISNATTEVNFNPATGLFSLSDFASGRTFVSQGNFNETTGTATITTASNSIFGLGQAIQFIHPDGNSDCIMLFSNLPFALFQSTLTNAGAATVISNRIHTLTALVNLNESTSSLKTLGTGGLSTPSGKSASYAWLAVADPQSRNGVVGAWLTSDRGSGVVSNNVNGSLVEMDAQIDYGRLQFLPGQTNALEIFALGYFDDARVGLESWANAVAQNYQIQLHPQPDGLCTYPMNQNGGASSPAAVAQLTSFVKTNLEYFGFNMIQFDAGWQGGITSTNGSNHGPTRVFTEYTNAYSAGVKPTADYMASNGITPGIWFEPFAGTSDDPYFTNHEDWFVETTNSTPYWCEWGGNSFDMTYQPARNYVSNMVSNITHNWDYMYFKMDGFWTGSATPLKYVNSGYSADSMGDAVFSNPAKPNIEAFRDGIKLVRQAAGTNVFFDGCNIAQNMRSYSGSFGLLDAMRVGPDNSASWRGWQRSTQYGSRHYFLQGRIWYNDPDTAYVRDGTFTTAEAETIGSWYGISGQLTLDGDWIPGLSAARLNILERIYPHHGLLPRPVDYFENDPPNIWLLTQCATNNAPRRDYVGFDFWSNSIIPNVSGSLQITVQPGACDIIAVRPQSGVPEVISTSRHVTQGIMDVLAENWDGTNTLSGTSKLVQNDPYELRIYSTNNWQLVRANVSAADVAAGVTISSATQTNGLTRVTLNSPTNRTVNWSAIFTQLPTVTLTSPTGGQTFYTNSTILLSASTTDSTGTITNVTFYNGATNLGTVTNAPYNLSISNLATGTYNFSAMAMDNNGITATSSVAQVQVQLPIQFFISATPASASILAGSTTNFSVTVTPTNNFAGTVNFSSGGLSSQMSANFNPASVSGSGSSTLTVTVSNGVSSGSYNLTILGINGGFTNSAMVTLVVNGAANLRWNPISSAWDTNTANWFNLGSGLNDVFQNGDNVLFDDSGNAFLNVTIGSGVAVAPSNIVVNADVNNYTISGAGKITGSTGIEKDGADTLTLSTINDFTGPVTINYGTLMVAATNALGDNGTSVIVNSGGTLDVNGNNLTAKPVVVSGQGFGGNGALVNNAAQQTKAFGGVTLAGDTTFGGNLRWDIRGGAATLSTSGQNYKITKVGPNQVSLVGISVDPQLGDIDIQQGMFAVQTTTSQLGNPTNTITVHNGAILETWALSSSPLNKNIVLNDGAIVTNESSASTVYGPVNLQGNGFIGAASGTTLTFTNVISGPGNLIKNAAGTVYLNASNTYTGNTIISNGILQLQGNGSIASRTITVCSNATLFAPAIFALNSGQTLTGNGMVSPGLQVNSNAVVSPGDSNVGIFTVSGSVTLNGTTLMKLNKTARTNDVLANNTAMVLSGTLMLTNMSGTLTATDTFKLFNSPALNYTGTLMNIVPAIPAVNLAWNTNTIYVDGILRITNSRTAPPKFAATKISSNNFTFNGSNGVPNYPYYVLTSTNIGLPLTNWTMVSTGTFDANGNFIFTNASATNAPQNFYLLKLQ